MDERELRRLTEPLLADPVIPATPVAEIRRRAARRTRQRAGAVAVLVVLVLAVGGTALARAGREGPSVQVGTTSPPAGQPDFRIFLAPTVSPAETDAIRAALLADPDVVSLVYADQADSYAQFRCFFRGQPDLLESVQPDQLPASFSMDVVGGQAEIDHLTTEFTNARGVKQVVSNPRYVLPLHLVPFTLPPGIATQHAVTVAPYPGGCPITGTTLR